MYQLFNRLSALTRDAGVKRYFFNTSWLFGEKIIRIISGLFIGIMIARYLGPQQYGILSYVIAFTSIFAGIAQLGLGSIIVREIVSESRRFVVFLGTGFWLKILGAFIAIILIALTLKLTNNDYKVNIYILIVASSFILQSFEVVEFYYQSQVKAKIISICKVIQLAVSAVIKIYILAIKAELIYFVLAVVFDTLTLAICYFLSYKLLKKPSFYKYFDLKVAKQLLKDSWPIILSSIAIMIYMRIDQIMIQHLLSQSSVGIYSAAVRISEGFNFIPMLITTSLFPAIIRAKKHNKELYLLRLQRLYNLMVFIGLSVALPMIFLSDWLIIILFGQEYQEAGPVLLINIWATIFVFLGVASGKWFVAENLQMLYFWRFFSGMVVNVVLNFLFIPIYGLKGAAFTTLLSQFIAAYFFDLFNQKTRSMFFMKTKALLGFNLFFK